MASKSRPEGSTEYLDPFYKPKVRKKPKAPKRYYVYCIRHKGIIRYVGRTNNVLRRQKEHIRSYMSGMEKEFYDYLRSECVDPKEIELEVIKEFKNIADSKRFEMYLILRDYFNSSGERQLYQSVPNIRDGW